MEGGAGKQGGGASLGVQIGGEEAAGALQGGRRREALHVGAGHDVLQEGVQLRERRVDRHLRGAARRRSEHLLGWIAALQGRCTCLFPRKP